MIADLWARRRALARGVAAALIACVRAYQGATRHMLAPRCRFWPSCSAYAREALAQHALGRALVLVASRLLRCQPFGRGGLDLVPPAPGGGAAR